MSSVAWSEGSPTTLFSPTSVLSPATLVNEQTFPRTTGGFPADVTTRDNDRVDVEQNAPGDGSAKWNQNRGHTDQPRWWFASTALPLLAATIGPLANVLSIAALVSYWRENLLVDGEVVGDFDGILYADPRWCYWLNVASLILGIAGNIFLLFNFTQRVRYIVALPMTVILWYFATGILIAITLCMHKFEPPIRPHQTYSQGYWYAVIAAVLYLLCSMGLMFNMLGYYLGHYPQDFTLTDPQRTLILQTMLFFFWLAGGAGVFSYIETQSGNKGWRFTDALYFCEVTILTVGFGDLAPSGNLGRGLVFPYSVGAIVILGLVISSITRSVKDLGEDKVVKRHAEKKRARTFSRVVQLPADLEERRNPMSRKPMTISPPFNLTSNTHVVGKSKVSHLSLDGTVHRLRRKTPSSRRPALLVLRKEKDRFDTMRRIQQQTLKFKRWFTLVGSMIAFAILWGVGGVGFWQAEKEAQGMTYFQALYFCYVSLLTIGYGDMSPRTNAGRCLFVVWAIIAIPTMTLLVSSMADTIIAKFNRGTFTLADFTVLPKQGRWRMFFERHPWIMAWMNKRINDHEAKKRVKKGFEIGIEDDIATPTIETLAAEADNPARQSQSRQMLAQRLALAIRTTARDLCLDKPRKYSYEEWAEFTRLIRFTSLSDSGGEMLEGDGLLDWDWIGSDSPMMAGISEAEFVMERLCESLTRYLKDRT